MEGLGVLAFRVLGCKGFRVYASVGFRDCNGLQGLEFRLPSCVGVAGLDSCRIVPLQALMLSVLFLFMVACTCL